MSTLTADAIRRAVSRQHTDVVAHATRVVTRHLPELTNAMPAGGRQARISRLLWRGHRTRNALLAAMPHDPVGRAAIRIAIAIGPVPTGQEPLSRWTATVARHVGDGLVLHPAARYGWWQVTDGTVTHWPVTIRNGAAITVGQPSQVHLIDAYTGGWAHTDDRGRLHITFPDGRRATMPTDLARHARAT